jgi:mevalonate kinase
MGAVYDIGVQRRKVGTVEYSKIIEWLYDLSKDENAWAIGKWDLRKKDLEKLNPIIKNKTNLKSDGIELMGNYLDEINSKIDKIDSIVIEYSGLYELAEKKLRESIELFNAECSEYVKLKKLQEQRNPPALSEEFIRQVIEKDYSVGERCAKQEEKYNEVKKRMDTKKEECGYTFNTLIEKNNEFLREVNLLTDTLKELCELYQTLTKK